MAQKIRDLRTLLDMNQAEFGKKLGGVPQATVSKWERGKQKPDSGHAVRLARLAGIEPHDWLGIVGLGETEITGRRIPVVGALQAGQWRDAVAYPEDDQRWIEAPLPPEFQRYDIQAFDLVGPSMNRVYPDGTIVYIASTQSYRAPENTDRVLVIRRNNLGLVEATLKEYVVGEDGKKWLWPRSHHPEHQAPLEYVKGSDGDEITVTGIVVAALVLERSRQMPKKRREKRGP